MKLFRLPDSTEVKRVIPKNAFDSYTNTKNKRLLTEKIARITWTHKLSKETINLEPVNISEIQIFKIELKVKDEILPVLEIIDKAIPYHIIFIVEYGSELYLSASTKHPHPTKPHNAVIDWTFRTEWISMTEMPFRFNLKKSIDAVFEDFCLQVSGSNNRPNLSLSSLIEHQQRVTSLQNEIAKLKSRISSCRQFNKKLELNIQLNEKERELNSIIL